ncbi:hypothetical protein [Paenibacillus sp. GYB003]|uniref:hypothetical protein n=1 Tax=Paenibacillus sp. GYB003 TaxID=2994392 RepID=UPI002F960CE3
MNTALLFNGQIVSAEEYKPEKHGHRLFCIDKNCKVPLIFVARGEREAHFKTTGKADSKHVSGCGFYEPLGVLQAIKKVAEYQEDLLKKGVKETVIRVNLNKLDPDYEPKGIERNPKEDTEEDRVEIKPKNENKQPGTITSVKTVAKLLTSYEPDLLASILLSIGGGRKVPLSSLIVDHVTAHKMLWSESAINTGYFVYGTISKVTRLEKVIYIDFEKIDDIGFTLVVFEKYFKYFTLKDKDLVGFDVLVYGMLKKNEHKGKNSTEFLIKSNKYIEKIRKL